MSRTNIPRDEDADDYDDDEGLLIPADLSTEGDEDSRRNSDVSSTTNRTVTQTSSGFPSSCYSSEISLPMSTLSMVAVSSKQSLAVPSASSNEKSKSGVKKFFRKIFGSSHHEETRMTSAEPLNIDPIHGTAYASMSPLPVTQGPIRLFVIRHGERLDRFYSSQWLQQAFDKDGNYCRFSPILP